MKITVTVSGPPGSGKSLITHQLAKTLKELGLKKVKVIEKELKPAAVRRRIDTPSVFVMAINEKKVEIEIVEAQTARDAV